MHEGDCSRDGLPRHRRAIINRTVPSSTRTHTLRVLNTAACAKANVKHVIGHEIRHNPISATLTEITHKLFKRQTLYYTL